MVASGAILICHGNDCRTGGEAVGEKRNTPKTELPVASQQLIALESQKEGSNIASGGIPIPSDAAFARRYLRVLTRRLMVVCALLIALSLSALPILSGLQVKQIVMEGCSYYDSRYLTDQSGVAVGDKLFACSPGDIQANLLGSCPYLASVSVDRRWNGTISISVRERTPRWALAVSSEKIALLDETMRVLEICSATDLEPGLCVISFELFPKSSEGEDKLVVGTTYDGNPAALNRLTTIATALSSAQETGLKQLDMTDPYDVVLTFADGDVYALGGCSSPKEQISKAQDSERAYRKQTGETGPLRVEVDDFLHVIIRPMPQNSE